MDAAAIKEIRKKQSLTQQELADELGVSLNTIQNWEGGSNIPKTKVSQINRYLETKKMLHEVSDADSKPFSADTALSFLIASNIRTEAAVEALTKIIAEIRSSDKKEKDITDVLGEISLTKAKVAKYLFHEFGG